MDVDGRTEADKEKLEELARKLVMFKRAFAQGAEPRWISILGPTGIGKTWLASRAFEAMRLKASRGPKNSQCEWEPHKIWSPDLEGNLGGKAPDPSWVAKYRDMPKWPVLFLDDIYSGPDPWGDKSADLFRLLGRRENQWTILTSNKSIGDIQQRDARLADRMIRGKNLVWNCERMDSYSVIQLRKAQR